MSQSRRPARTTVPRGRTAGPSKSPAPQRPAAAKSAVTKPAVVTTSAQLSVLVRKIAELEAKNARIEAERAADAEQIGRLLAATADAEARARVLDARLEKERKRGTDVHGRLLAAALSTLRETLSRAEGDPVVEELDRLLRTTLAAIETLHDHADAVEQLAEITKVSAERHEETIVARTFAAVAARAHATQAEIETVDGLLAGVSEQVRSVRKLRASLEEARSTLVAQIAQIVTAVRTLRAVTGSLATGAPPALPSKSRRPPKRITKP